MLAETCVFDKQSKEPIYCGPQQRKPPGAPLIANLRGHFAEFLNHRSPERLSLLDPPTCVSFSTVNVLQPLEAFLGRPSIHFPVYASQVCTLYYESAFTSLQLSTRHGHFYSYRCISGRRPSIGPHVGAGILTCYPSATPFGLTLGTA